LNKLKCRDEISHFLRERNYKDRRKRLTAEKKGKKQLLISSSAIIIAEKITE